MPPLPRLSLLRSSVGLLVAGAVVLGVVIAAALLLTERSNRLSDRIVAEQGLRATAVDLLTALVDAETGYRGYLISADPAFLAPYHDGLKRVPDLQADLAERMRRDLGDTETIADLPAAIARRLDLMAEPVALVGQGDLDLARAEVATGAGREAMDRVRAILDTAIADSDARIGPAIARQRVSNRGLLATIVIASAAMAGLAGLAIAVVARHIRALTAAQAEIAALNRGLEARVALRTRDLTRANDEIQRFAYVVTHDLRAPLVNILGFSGELEAALPPLRAALLEPEASEQDRQAARDAVGADLPEAIGFIRSSARKMDGLINAILRIAREGRRDLRPERIDFDALAQQATDAVRHQIDEAGGSVTIENARPVIVSDRLSLDQILGNLVDNAVKYADPGRPLALRLRARPSGPGEVEIEVEDNGRGIASEDQARVFDLFRRSGAQTVPGEGIGLAHVRSLARRLGGEIELRSTPGRGSTFVLRLPSQAPGGQMGKS